MLPPPQPTVAILDSSGGKTEELDSAPVNDQAPGALPPPGCQRFDLFLPPKQLSSLTDPRNQI